MVKDALKVLLDANLRLSKNFRVKEFFNSTTATLQKIENCPPTYVKLMCVLSNLQKLSDMMEIVRAANGEKPIYVTSGYRCNSLNEKVGGSPLSKHPHGAAVDFTAKDFEYLCDTMEWLELKGVYWYANKAKKYIHLQLNDYLKPPPTVLPYSKRTPKQ